MVPNKQEKIGGWLSVTALACLGFAACGEKPQSPPPQATPPKLFQQERGAIEKARGVEQAEAKGAEDLKREAERQAQ